MMLHNYRVLLSLLLQLSIENACRLSTAALDTRSTTINFKSDCTDTLTHTHTPTHTQLVGVRVEFAVSPRDLCAQSQSERALKNQKPQGRLCKTSKTTGSVRGGGLLRGASRSQIAGNKKLSQRSSDLVICQDIYIVYRIYTQAAACAVKQLKVP